MALDMTSFAAALKQHYMDLTVQNLVYKNNAHLALLKKYEQFGGANMPFPLIYGNPQGRSQDFSRALANKTSSQIKAFTLTRNHDYALANIDNETIEASIGDSNAFMRAATTEIDGAIQANTRSLAGAVLRDGSGVLGQISAGSTVGSATITLADVNDVVNFEVGMTLKASTAVTSGLESGTVSITAIDRDAGTLTASGNWSAGIATVAAGDYLSVDGDFGNKIKGVASWIPLTAPTGGDNFFGVDRSVDTVRLAGVRKDFRGVPIEEAQISLANSVGLQGGIPDYNWMSFTNYANLEKALGSKVMYVNVQANAQIAFTGIKVIGPKGPITVLPDLNMPSDRMYMLQSDTWELCSLGMAPKLLKSDGLEFLRVSTADAVEVRVGYYAQLGCHGPGFNGVGRLA